MLLISKEHLPGEQKLGTKTKYHKYNQNDKNAVNDILRNSQVLSTLISIIEENLENILGKGILHNSNDFTILFYWLKTSLKWVKDLNFRNKKNN